MKKSIFKKAVLTLVLASGVLGLTSCADEKNDNSTSTTNPDVVVPSTNPSTNPSTKPSTKPSTTPSTTPSTNPSTNPSTTPSTNPTPTPTPDEFNCISIAEALVKAKENTNERYYVRGTIKEVSNATYGEMTITDGKDELYVYGTYSADGEKRYSEMADKPVTGDEVVLYTKLGTHKDKEEAKSAWIVDFTHIKQEVDPSEYVEMSINDARDAKADSKVKVSGVVVKITYANGLKPNGFMLADETGSTYVYGSAANDVSEGNTITVAATKTYFINPSESENSNKYGYKGSNQLSNPIILENDKKVSAYNKSSIEEITIKEAISFPTNIDFTGKLYKANALVKKTPGDGFVNYYLYDLDAKTGSYVYTQANGNDFTWLDEFDGKICTVYFTVLNCKATDSGLLYRLLPVEVLDESFKLAEDKHADFVNEYYIKDQFIDTYNADPELEVITTVTNELLSLNATISYTSSNESVIKFNTTSTATVMNALAEGSATITATITAGGKTITATRKINVVYQNYEYTTIIDALNSADSSEVTVKGIVGPSISNKTGFYLIDETGMVAVEMSGTELAKVQLGNEVILKGIKLRRVNADKADKVFGQTEIKDATILLNLFGEHEYSRNNIVEGKTISELSKMIKANPTKDFTTTLYKVEAKVSAGSYSTIYLNDLTETDDNGKPISLQMYSNGAAQSAFMKQFDGKIVTVELTFVNWNSKGYKLQIHSATCDGVTAYNDYNFSK